MFLLYKKTCDYSRVNKSQVKILFLGCPNQKLLTEFILVIWYIVIKKYLTYNKKLRYNLKN